MPTGKIFISFDSRDQEWVKRNLLPALKKVDLAYYDDNRDLELGRSINTWIEQAIGTCRAAILVISHSYINNTRYARYEYNQIVTRLIYNGLQVVPIFIGDHRIDDLPLGVTSLHGIQWTDLPALEAKLTDLRNQLASDRLFSSVSLDHGPPQHDGSETQRRIRIQTSSSCNRNCSYCHHDEFPPTDQTKDIERLRQMVQNLASVEARGGNNQPMPRIEFTWTGGEPLKNNELPDLIREAKGKSYLITNGDLLDQDKADQLVQAGLKDIRISLHPDTGKQSVPLDAPLEKKLASVFNNVAVLLRTKAVRVRFNYVVGSSQHEPMEIIEAIRERFGKYIPDQVQGIALIQKTVKKFHYVNDKNPETMGTTKSVDAGTGTIGGGPKFNQDSLDGHSAYREIITKAFGSLVRDWKPENRVTEFLPWGPKSLKVELVRLNCDLDSDLIKRCFLCVQEKDISIGIDGRVRVCSGWNERMEPRLNYANVSQKSPMVGISNLIRRHYGVAGFYGHFPFFRRKLTGEPIPHFFNTTLEGRNVINELSWLMNDQISIQHKKQPLWTLVRKVTQLDSPFCRLYEEGLHPADQLKRSIELAELLLRWAFDLASPKMGLEEKIQFNVLLLLLAYLCVDESLYSTARTLLVRGMTLELLDRYAANEDLFVDERKNEFFLDSVYCLGTLAFENSRTEEVECFLEAMNMDAQSTSFKINYLWGSVYRQLQDKPSAEMAHSKAAKFSHEFLNRAGQNENQWNNQMRLAREIRVESNRSLGALLKNDPGEAGERSQTAYSLAEYFSSRDPNRIQYMLHFSHGYSKLVRFFREEYNNWREEMPPPIAREAYQLLSSSIRLDGSFYASLIRIALLDLAFGDLDEAVRHTKQAETLFKQRGLLSDQEYLNYQLCSFILKTAEFSQNQTTQPTILLAVNTGVGQCNNIGPQDKQCVQEDFTFLDQIIQKRWPDRQDLKWPTEMRKAIQGYIEAMKPPSKKNTSLKPGTDKIQTPSPVSP
ncbi:MAG: TIR domain-containing protein [Magnetococcales bacterium]|nr:TIR domain-containing protein [Magnetococcales bacterium]